MWRKDQVWLHYVKNIIAADVSSAVFLGSYLRHSRNTKSYVQALEIFDLQKYKLITKVHKVRGALRDRSNIPFIFVVGKN